MSDADDAECAECRARMSGPCKDGHARIWNRIQREMSRPVIVGEEAMPALLDGGRFTFELALHRIAYALEMLTRIGGSGAVVASKKVTTCPACLCGIMPIGASMCPACGAKT